MSIHVGLGKSHPRGLNISVKDEAFLTEIFNPEVRFPLIPHRLTHDGLFFLHFTLGLMFRFDSIKKLKIIYIQI
jgi:hypothetical protein